MSRTIRLVCLAAILAAPAAAQEVPMDAGHLAHAVDRLGTTARVLYVAAHPDDENTRLLAYLANVRHVTAAYLSMTRGGGGQNLIGSELAELLDVIRTEELLAHDLQRQPLLLGNRCPVAAASEPLQNV